MRKGPSAALCIVAGMWGSPTSAAETSTFSDGFLQTATYESDGRQNNSYQTRVTAAVGETLLFDQTYFRDIADPAAQAGLMEATRVRGYALNGAPAAIRWGQVQLIDSYEELLDSFTETSYFTRYSTVATQQVTSGDHPDAYVFTGSRGYCYDAGSSGPTNFGDRSGAFASCDYADEIAVSPGDTNTNTHTTTVEETVESSFTNTDILVVQHFSVTGEAVPIGTIHTAAQTGAIESGIRFLDRLVTDEAVASSGLFWAEPYGRWARTRSSAQASGHSRSSSGIAGGVSARLGATWQAGIAIDHGDTDIDVYGAPEHGTVKLTQIALHARVGGAGPSFGTAAVSYGFGHARTRHGDAALGGISEARYDVGSWAAAAEAGYRLRAGGLTVTPRIGLGWHRLRSDAFSEAGGIALEGQRHRMTRIAGTAGLDLGYRVNWGASAYLSMVLYGRITEVFSGEARTLPVTLSEGPAEQLRVTGAREASTGAAVGVRLAAGLQPGIALFARALASRADGLRSEQFGGGLRVSW